MTTFEFTILFLCTVVFGSIIGAYLSTARYRIQYDKPLITKECFCPSCGHTLPLLHQIPILSWLFLKGQCCYCHSSISKSYPLTEGGFLIYYGLSFLLLWTHPIVLTFLWLLTILILLFLHCHGHFRSMIKGFLIFAGYHIIYGALLSFICAALWPLYRLHFHPGICLRTTPSPHCVLDKIDVLQEMP